MSIRILENQADPSLAAIVDVRHYKGAYPFPESYGNCAFWLLPDTIVILHEGQQFRITLESLGGCEHQIGKPCDVCKAAY